jgi:hypothetical protein
MEGPSCPFAPRANKCFVRRKPHANPTGPDSTTRIAATAAMAGSRCSLMPSRMRRGRVKIVRLAMNSTMSRSSRLWMKAKIRSIRSVPGDRKQQDEARQRTSNVDHGTQEDGVFCTTKATTALPSALRASTGDRHSLFTLIQLQDARPRALLDTREQEVRMERGLLAPLSPNEQTALRRIANGISKSIQLRPTSVERLKKLALVEEREGAIQLTALGQQRHLADQPLDKPAA